MVFSKKRGTILFPRLNYQTFLGKVRACIFASIIIYKRKKILAFRRKVIYSSLRRYVVL